MSVSHEPDARARAALGGGVSFLRKRQLPTGEFRSYNFTIGPPRGRRVQDSTPFVTCQIAYSLGFVDSPPMQEVRERAVSFLQAAMEPPGVWRYWSPGHPYHKSIPADLDDTSCVSHLLASTGRGAPDNRGLLLANRDATGRFYTWVRPRRSAGGNLMYWAFCARDLRRAAHYRAFWKMTEAEPDDVDAGVNANVLLYLGESESTLGAVDLVTDVVEQGGEDDCDKWYRDRAAVYYLYSRAAFHSVPSLRRLGGVVVERVLARQHADGSFGNALETALGACTLINLGAEASGLDRAIAALIDLQSADGSWPCEPYYYGGPKRHNAWGSEELTTALCVEALCRSLARRRPD